MTSSLTRQLSEVLGRPVDRVTRERAALHVLDWLGCAVIGASEPAGRLLVSRAAALPRGSVTVIGGPNLGSPEEAAFINGGLGNILEMDDVHRTAILHPGPVAIPAALAAAEAAGAQGTAFLDAVVRGYEAEIRLGESLGPGHYAKWHNTATCGPFGAAAAVADVLGLGPDEQVWALGNAATQSSGPWRCRHEAVMTKQLHTARAAQAGYAAAALAALGFTGPDYMLEGEQGFYDAMCPDPDPERLLANPTGDWKVWETSFKPWPACRHAHPAIDAALVLHAAHPGANIVSVRIETYGDALKFCDTPAPTNTHEAKFSLQHAVALTLADGPPGLDGFLPEAIARPDVTRLRNAATVVLNQTFDDAYPNHFGARVAIGLSDGATDSATVADALGDPENPVSAEQIVAKARRLMAAGGASADPVDRIIAATLALPDGGTLDALSQALRELHSNVNEGIRT